MSRYQAFWIGLMLGCAGAGVLGFIAGALAGLP